MPNLTISNKFSFKTNSCKNVLKEILPCNSSRNMTTRCNQKQINHHINNEWYKCCGLKKQHLEMFKLNLPANVVNNTGIVDYH